MFQPIMTLIKFFTETNLDGFIIFLNDEHDNEYISEADNHIKNLTGFTGSYGYAVILKNKKVLYTDSRYFLQAKRELKNGFELMRIGEDKKLSEFLKENDAFRIGYNPLNISKRMYERLNVSLDEYEIKLVEQDGWMPGINFSNRNYQQIMNIENVNLFSAVKYLKNEKCLKWFEKMFKNIYPDFRKNLDTEKLITGICYIDKIQKIRDFLNEKEGYLLTLLDSISWVFNLRGSDIPCNPVFYSYAYITKTEAYLFTNTKIYLNGVINRDYKEFYNFLSKIEEEKIYSSDRINRKIDILLGKKLKITDFVENLKSVKTNEEIVGFFESAIMDGIALVKLMSWIQQNLDKKEINEIDVSEKLIKIKSEFDNFVSPSFETIAAYGPNAAEVHHNSGKTILGKSEPFLLDSGSQYIFGTTDITRTVHFGKPTDDQKYYYTLVLKGQINSKLLKGPANHLPYLIQNVPRIPLWDQNEDYGHSTSHGVGHFLNVHESPPNMTSGYKLREKQIFSIEPGIYKENKIGIRIEDVVVTVPDGSYLSLKNLTLVPLHYDLIDWDSLNNEQIRYLKMYNEMVFDCLSDFLKDDPLSYDYLRYNTNIGKNNHY